MKKMMSKALIGALVASGIGLARADLDETLVAPSASVVFYVHGHLNIVFASNDTTRAFATYASSTQEKAIAFDVEMRAPGAGDDAWTSCAGALSKYANYNETDFRDTSRFYWLSASALDATVEVRARIRITKEGDPKTGAWSAWSNLGTADVLNEVSGTVIQSPNVESGRIGKADDGDVNTYYEDSKSNPSWTGLDAGGEVVVSRIRFTQRNFNTTVQARGRGAVFEAAHAADFSDAVPLHTVPNDYDPFAVNDVQLATPVRARYFRVRTTQGNCCNLTEVQWVGHMACAAALAGDGGESDYRARVTVTDVRSDVSSLKLLRGYSAEGPFAAISESVSTAGFQPVVDEVSGVGLPCFYCWECAMNDGLVLTGAVSSVYIRPRQLERDAADQTKLGEGVVMLPVNALSPDVTYTVNKPATTAFDGDTSDNSSPNVYKDYDNPVIGVTLPAPAHLVCAFVCADCRNSTRAPRMRNLRFYGAADGASLADGDYVQLAAPITTYQEAVDDQKWFRYNSTNANDLYACLFGYAPGNGSISGQWCGHSREIRFVGWTEEDAITSGKVLAPAGVTVQCRDGVTVGWTAAVNATSLKIERRPQGSDDWTLVAADVAPSVLSYADTAKLRGGTAYEYRVTAIGLGGLMSTAAEPVAVDIPKSGLLLIFR